MSTKSGPIFVAGTDRSGPGLLAELLDAHPRVAISRRTNFWTFYYQRFGDLRQPQNLERCLNQMLQYTRIQALNPDRDAVVAAFSDGEPTYARLLALIEEQHTRRLGKARWGDKSLNSEGDADVILREFPDAVMLHVLRDPRDRYASQATHRRAPRGQVGSGVALWRWSARLARRNEEEYAARYMVVRYEDLATDAEATLRRVCTFVGEDFAVEMLRVPAGDARGEHRPRTFTTASIGRYHRDLRPRDIAIIDLLGGHDMRAFGYSPTAQKLSGADRWAFILLDIPLNLMRMTAWWAQRAWSGWRQPRPAARRIRSVSAGNHG